ncbi:unnamed protein product, partial [Strongylus vulgaris]
MVLENQDNSIKPFFRQLETSIVEETKPIPNNRRSSEVKVIKEMKKETTSFDADIDYDDGKLRRGSLKDEEKNLSLSHSSASEAREKARKSLPTLNSIMGTSDEYDPDIPKPEISR